MLLRMSCGINIRFWWHSLTLAEDLKFSLFEVILLILSIIVVGNFLRDRESNYLEGVLCILVYLIIAVTAYYYPNISEESSGEDPNATGMEVVHQLLTGHS